MVRLAAELAAGSWPDVLALPTGSAKTEIVAVWAWALAAAGPGAVPRRLWLAQRPSGDGRPGARGSAGAPGRLGDPQAPPEVAAVALALQRLGGGQPLRVGLLRGGIVTDDEPLLDPVTPMIVATTIDQVGSRLLWRAYGAPPREWPIWAGLAGEDSAIVLDEAHLSAAAEATFQRASKLGAGIRLLSMTATPRGQGRTFTLDETDRAHPVLQPAPRGQAPGRVPPGRRRDRHPGPGGRGRPCCRRQADGDHLQHGAPGQGGARSGWPGSLRTWSPAGAGPSTARC